MKHCDGVRLRRAEADDLERINRVLEAAIMTWDMPDRVKRLSLPSYRYDTHDLEHLEFLLAESADATALGIAAWEPAETEDGPPGRRGLLLHGIYVAPEQQRRGVGACLLASVSELGRARRYDGLLVKANRDARGFFVAMGLELLPILRPGRDYPYRYWQDLGARDRS